MKIVYTTAVHTVSTLNTIGCKIQCTNDVVDCFKIMIYTCTNFYHLLYFSYIPYLLLLYKFELLCIEDQSAIKLLKMQVYDNGKINKVLRTVWKIRSSNTYGSTKCTFQYLVSYSTYVYSALSCTIATY